MAITAAEASRFAGNPVSSFHTALWVIDGERQIYLPGFSLKSLVFGKNGNDMAFFSTFARWDWRDGHAEALQAMIDIMPTQTIEVHYVEVGSLDRYYEEQVWWILHNPSVIRRWMGPVSEDIKPFDTQIYMHFKIECNAEMIQGEG